MKPCADCAPAGAPEDSVRSAAALWVSAGKTSGFAEGVRWACDAVERTVPELIEHATKLELPSKKRARLTGLLHSFIAQLRQQAGQREQESKHFEKAATAMVTRFEQGGRASRGIRARFLAALSAFQD